MGVLDANLSWVATLEAEGLSWPGPVGVATTRAGEVWVADFARSLVVRVTTTR